MLALSDFALGPTGFSKARRPSLEDELRAVADKASPKLRLAILEALRSGNEAKITEIAAALELGDVNKVLAILGLDNLERRFGAAQREIRAIMGGAGKVVEPRLPSARRLFGPSLRVVVDVANPATMDFVAQYDLRLIREISENTREGIRSLIRDGMENGVNPRTVATQVKQQVGLTSNQQKWVANFRRELEGFHDKMTAGGWNLGGKKTTAPGGAGVMILDQNGKPIDGIMQRRLRDFRYDKTLMRAMQTGKPLTQKQIDKMVERYSERLLKFRADSIARTEALRAANAGSHIAWQQAIQQGAVDKNAVKRFWRTAGDERVREDHRAIPRLNPDGVEMEQPFVTPMGPVLIPPAGVNCRCVVVYKEVGP